jgi:hypothetical protein
MYLVMLIYFFSQTRKRFVHLCIKIERMFITTCFNGALDVNKVLHRSFDLL